MQKVRRANSRSSDAELLDCKPQNAQGTHLTLICVIAYPVICMLQVVRQASSRYGIHLQRLYVAYLKCCIATGTPALLGKKIKPSCNHLHLQPHLYWYLLSFFSRHW